jgi:hypothetical protein
MQKCAEFSAPYCMELNGKKNALLRVWSQQVDATPSDVNLLCKGVVYDPRETGGAFCDAEERDLELLEGGTVVARDRARLREGSFVHSFLVIATRWKGRRGVLL